MYLHLGPAESDLPVTIVTFIPKCFEILREEKKHVPNITNVTIILWSSDFKKEARNGHVPYIPVITIIPHASDVWKKSAYVPYIPMITVIPTCVFIWVQ